ncbi:MAG: hypothetical protein ABFR65_07695 [Pseudomonadota bacterium]
MITARLNLLVALPAEARPINRMLGLRRLQPDGELPIYTGDQIALVLTGHGTAAAKRGVSYLRGLNRSRHGRWLNLGIAGHGDLALGQAMIASRVITPGAQQSWTMQYLDMPDCLAVPVQSLLQPLEDYSSQTAYDMEAAGFGSAVLEFAPLASLQVVKIISDNRQHPASGINAKMVSALIQQQSTLIRQLVNRMLYD